LGQLQHQSACVPGLQEKKGRIPMMIGRDLIASDSTTARSNKRRTSTLRLLLTALFCLLLAYPWVAFSSSRRPSQVVMIRTDGQNGHPSTSLRNTTLGPNHLRMVATSNASHSGHSAGISPDYVDGGSSTIFVDFDEPLQFVEFAWYDLTTCESSQLTPYFTTAPQYGIVQYTFGTGTVAGGTCDGSVVPVTYLYYTWDTHTSASLSDYFVVNATDPDGDQFYWDGTPELLAKGDGDCGNEPGTCAAGDPISVGSGNVFEPVTDYQTAGQNKLSYIRYYNSLPVPNTFTSTLGNQWRSNYDRYLGFFSSSFIVTERPDGQLINFYNSGGSWVSDSDADYTLTQSGNTWILTDPEDTVETYTELSTGEGLLQSITLRNGYAQTMTYNTNNQLTEVMDSYNRQLALTYSNGVVSTVITPDGLVLTYGYNSINSVDDQLASVSYSTSPVTSQQYLYQDSNSPYALTSIQDEDGNTYQSWTYDSIQRGLTNQVGGLANLITISYDDSNLTRTVTNALGVTDTYTFSILQDTPKVTQISRAATSSTAAATETSTYDANGYLASQTDWGGNETTYVNNSHGDPTSINEAVGSPAARTTTIAYNTTWVHLPDTITTPGLTTTFTYDGSGDVLTKTLTDTTSQSVPYATNGQTRVWKYTWNNSLLASVQSPRTDVAEKTSYTYDSTGALTAIKNPVNQQTTISSHTPDGLPETIVDPNGTTTNLTYDPRNHLLTSTVVVSTGNRVTTYGYDAAENLTSVTQPDGSGLTYTYDAAHRLTGITDLLGNKISYTLDALGDPGTTDVLNSSSTITKQHSNTFDALGRMLEDIGASNQAATFTYDPMGHQLTSEDQVNNTTQRAFDALNRLDKITDPESGVTTTSYDAHDRPLSVVAPTGGTTSYVYDGFGDLIQESSSDSGTTVYYYDSTGNQVNRTTATGAVTQYTYDALDRVSNMTFPSDSTENVAYTYDQTGHGSGIGRLTSVSDAAGTLSRSYDQLGNLLSDARTTGTIHLTTTYSYDLANRIASITYPSGALVSYTRDTMGRITAVTEKPSGGTSAAVVSSVAYEPFGPDTGLRYGSAGQETRGFDQDYRLTNVTDLGTVRRGVTRVSQNLSYAYFPTNNVQTITDAVNSGNSQSFSYDTLQRLSAATGGYGTYGFTYDKDGNRLTQALGGVTTSYGYGTGNDLLSTTSVGGVTTQTIGYTADGRMATLNPGIESPGSHLITSLSYNQDARLAALNAGSDPLASYTYDGFGQRLLKTVSSTYGNIYQYGQNGMLLEETDQSGAAQADYIYLNGRPVADLAPSSGTLYFMHDDLLGTPQLATDSSQNIAWQASYEPFGKTSSVSGSITQNLRLPGQYFDVESGWNHNGFRNYMPDLGRFTEPDPLGLRGSALSYQLESGSVFSSQSVFGAEDGWTNPYVYVENSPISYVDLLGLQTTVIIWNPVGYGESSEGHVSTIINGTSYSYGPWGMDIRPADQYLAINEAFRDGLGYNLDITPDQEQELANFLHDYDQQYHALTNNCVSPVKQGLESLGIPLIYPLGAVTELPPLVWIPSDFQFLLENTPNLVTGWTPYPKQ
jgi:RHS repeat-associated protein